MIGRMVALQKSSSSGVSIILDGAVVGQLDSALGNQVALAIDRGLSLTGVIQRAYPIYNDKFKQTGAQIDIKVEYLLERGQSAIETPDNWRCVESPQEFPSPGRSFFTKVAGVTFEGRQRIVARCSEGENLVLVRDPGNRHDKGAIKVMRLNGEQLGFLPAHVSRGDDPSGLAFRMDRGDTYRCRISSLTGGGGRSLGVNIEITEGECDTLLPAPTIPAPPGVAPLGWWLFAAVAVLLLVVAVIARN
jgi:hypothetical protein